MILALALPLTVASGLIGDNVMKVFGNANMDNRIDEGDIAYVQGIINGTNKPTDLADADYNGKIDSNDIDQIKKIIAGQEKEITIIDAQKRNITLGVPIKKAISVNSGSIEIMRALGVDIKTVLVGVTSYALKDPLYWPELKNEASLKYGSPDYELIAKLKPDVVILYSKPYKDESFDKFDKIGIPVICLNCHDENVLESDIRTLGLLFNKEDNADSLIKWYNGYKDSIMEKVKTLSTHDKPRVLFYGYPDSYYPAFKARTGQSGDSTMLIEAGGINIAENLSGTSGTADIDKEWVMKQNPDIIVADVLGGGFSGYSSNETALQNMKKIRDELLADPAVNATNAGKNGKVFIICTDLNRGPMEAAGVAYLAKYFHPELFKDLNPQSILQEYFQKWQGIPYHGYFVYPPLE